mgnify:CR=1 FL=1
MSLPHAGSGSSGPGSGGSGGGDSGQPERPRTPVPAGVWLLLALAWAVLIGTQLWGLMAYGSMPNPIATHFELDGTPDAYAPLSPFAAFGPLWIFGCVGALLTALVIWVDRMPQHFGSLQLRGEAYARSTRAGRWFISVLLLTISVLIAFSCLSSWFGGPTQWFAWTMVPTLAVVVIGIPWMIRYMGAATRHAS